MMCDAQCSILKGWNLERGASALGGLNTSPDLDVASAAPKGLGKESKALGEVLSLLILPGCTLRGDAGLIARLGGSPGEGKGNPL